MLLTYDLHIRKTDPCFHLVSCYENNIFRSQMKNSRKKMKQGGSVHQVHTCTVCLGVIINSAAL